MFTLTVHDEQVYRRLMERVEQRGESLDAVLRELLEQDEPNEENASAAEQSNGNQLESRNDETPMQKLVRLIHASNLVFDNPIDGEDVEDVMRREAGDFSWRDDDGAN